MAEGETFTWDERKRESVLKKHGVDFQTAIRMFGGPVVVTPSNCQGESRWKAIGVVDGKEFIAV